jgi:hypothetical protein
MGLTFKTEEERNPVRTKQVIELEDKVEMLEKKLALHEQFLNDNGYGVLFDVFVDMIDGKVTPEQYKDLTGQIEFEEVTE